MARQLRIEFPGAFYHVMARGNEKREIYTDNQDRQKFLGYLESAANRYGAVIHCYCLMGNHYHLLLQTPNGNLSQVMHHINGSFTTYFNTRHNRVGHLFQGRYKSILIDADSYCLALSRYIHLNPVADQNCLAPDEYKWSSYRYYLNLSPKPAWLKRDFVLSLLSNSGHSELVYQRYVEESQDDINDIWKSVESSQPILGDDRFVKQVADHKISQDKSSHDLLASNCLRNINPDMDQVSRLAIEKTQHDYRLAKKLTIYFCHQYGGLPLKEIGEYFGLSNSAVTKSSTRFASLLVNDQRLAETVASMLAVLKMSNVKTRPLPLD